MKVIVGCEYEKEIKDKSPHFAKNKSDKKDDIK